MVLRGFSILTAVAMASPTLASAPPELTCELEVMCIVFSEGFSQCAKIERSEFQITSEGVVALRDNTLKSTVTHDPEAYLPWVLTTEPDRFGLVYDVQIGSNTTTIKVINEGEVRGDYSARCWEPEK